MQRRLALAALAVAGLARPVAAQDAAHYWTFGYGPIGQLTEGTLVGGVSDLSSTYYNPAACALIDRPSFVFSLNSIDIARLDVPNAAGQGLDLNQSVFRVVPAMVAFHLGPHEDGANHFAAAFLSRYDTDVDVGFSAANVSPTSPDASAAYGRFKQRLLEYWAGIDWSRRLSRRFSLGISPFFAYRAQRVRRTLAVEQLSDSVSHEAFLGREDEYDHLRILAKLGVAWRPGDWELGATVTAPGFKLWGKGKTVFNATAASGTGTNLLAASTQQDLDASFKAPWSVAAGATRRFRSTAIHSTVEWVSAVSAYDILKLDPAPIAGSPQTIPLYYRGESRSVVNFGMGFEQQLGETVHAYGGAARNRSSYVAERDSFSPWDLTDVTLGLSVDRGRRRLALGVGYAWGSGDLEQLVAPPDESGPPPSRPARYYRFRISLGASFNN